MSKKRKSWSLVTPFCRELLSVRVAPASRVLLSGAVLLTGSTFLFACASATPEPEAPVEEPALEETSPEPSESEPAPEATQESAESSSSESLTPEDFQAALQVVIQDDALQTAMNLTEPGRFPIKISGEGLPANLKLTAGEKAVEVVPTPADPKKEAVLIFSKVEISGNRVSFKYRYDIEGVRGTSTVAKKDDVWELKASRISEY
jgi:hypothetical protein